MESEGISWYKIKWRCCCCSLLSISNTNFFFHGMLEGPLLKLITTSVNQRIQCLYLIAKCSTNAVPSRAFYSNYLINKSSCNFCIRFILFSISAWRFQSFYTTQKRVQNQSSVNISVCHSLWSFVLQCFVFLVSASSSQVLQKKSSACLFPGNAPRHGWGPAQPDLVGVTSPGQGWRGALRTLLTQPCSVSTISPSVSMYATS